MLRLKKPCRSRYPVLLIRQPRGLARCPAASQVPNTVGTPGVGRPGLVEKLRGDQVSVPTADIERDPGPAHPPTHPRPGRGCPSRGPIIRALPHAHLPFGHSRSLASLPGGKERRANVCLSVWLFVSGSGKCVI